MSIDSLRKRLKEQLKNGTLDEGYIAPELPGMGEPYQPAAPSPVDTYNPPELDVPDVQTPTPVSTPTNNTPVNTSVPSAKTTSTKAKVDPKTGANGAKAFDDITTKSPQFSESGMGNTDLINAYNAGLNGIDLDKETRDNAAAGGYLDSIETMFNAGLQDADLSKNVDDFNPEKVDNTKNLSYTAGNATGNTDAGTNSQDEYVPKMGADTSKQATSNSTSSDKPYKISDKEKELNYMMDMLFMNGAANSNDPSVQAAYQWLSNPDNKGQEIPDEVKNAFYAFISGVTDDQIARSNQIAVGKKDDVGLVKSVYKEKEAIKKASNDQSGDDVNGLLAKYNISPVKSTPPTSENLKEYLDFVKTPLGKAGQLVMDEIIKPDPETFAKRSGILFEAYQAGFNDYDLTKEKIDIAKSGGYLDDVLKLYFAGQADKNDSKKQNDFKPSNLESGNDFYKCILGSLSAESSKSDFVKGTYQTAFEYFNNSANIGKEIPKDVTNALNTFLKSVDPNEIVSVYESLKGIDKLEGLKNKVKLQDGSYSDEEETIIKEGPYAGCTISQGFNDTTNPTNRGHLGYDIKGNFTDIHPIFDGYIVAIQPEEGEKNGITITIRHINSQGQEFYSTYSHMAENSISQDVIDYFEAHKGDDEIVYPNRVTTESIIGQKGNTGDSNGPHLHLSVYTRSGPTRNPFGYTENGKVFEDYKDYNANNYYYDMFHTKKGYQGRYFDPYLVMITNGDIISLFPKYVKG